MMGISEGSSSVKSVTREWLDYTGVAASPAKFRKFITRDIAYKNVDRAVGITAQ